VRRLWGVLAILLMIAGCTGERVAGTPDRTEAPAGAFDLETPIELARVSQTATEATTEMVDQDGSPLHVEAPFLTVTRLDRATVEMQQTTWGLAITLTEEDGAVFSRWTEEHTGEQVAMIVGGEVVSAPAIQEPIPGREVSISAQYTQSEAQALLHEITGR
jgi:preprotein translocase subunit SecD